MRRLIIALFLVASTIFQAPAIAQDSISPSVLVGRWAASENGPNGSTISTTFTLTQDMKFSGTAAVNGHKFWSYSGSWQVSGKQLIWQYELSSRPLPASVKTDVDDILSVNATKLVLSSHLSGKQHEFTRIP